MDGPAGSGKTTFAGRLGAAAGARVIHSDDFPVPWEGPPDAWFPPLADQVLAPLARGEAGGFRRYDWVRGAPAEPVPVPVAPVLLLEGVGAARRAAPVCHRIWVEAPRPLRLARVLRRDGAHLEPRWRAWLAAEERWFAADGTRGRADLLVDGAARLPHDPETEFVTR